MCLPGEWAPRYRTTVLSRYVIVALTLGACAQADSFKANPDASSPNGRPDAPRGSSPDAAHDPDLDAPQTQGLTGTHLVINEIDYDEVGTDTKEFVEIFNPTPASIDLTGIMVELVNGANGAVYTTVDLSSEPALASGGYLVVADSAVSVAAGATAMYSWTTNAIQNGSPDGVALVDTSNATLVDALSYEGAMTSVAISGMGMVSLVEGTPTTIADSNTVDGSLCRSPNGQDTDDAATDWKFCTTPTPGAVNAL